MVSREFQFPLNSSNSVMSQNWRWYIRVERR